MGLIVCTKCVALYRFSQLLWHFKNVKVILLMVNTVNIFKPQWYHEETVNGFYSCCCTFKEIFKWGRCTVVFLISSFLRPLCLPLLFSLVKRTIWILFNLSLWWLWMWSYSAGSVKRLLTSQLHINASLQHRECKSRSRQLVSSTIVVTSVM